MTIWISKTKGKGVRYKPMVRDASYKWMKSHTWDRIVDAKKEERMLLKAKDDGFGAEIFASLSFAKAIEQWRLDCERRGSSASNLYLVELLIKNHFLPFFGRRNIKSVRPMDISAFIAYLVKKGLANVTVNRIITTLKACFNFHIEEDSLSVNPVKKKHRLPNIKSNTKPVWTMEEAEKFLAHVNKKYSGDSRWNYLLYKIALNCGMRYGEIIALERSDFEFDKNRIKVSKSFCNVSHKIKAPKNNKIRYATLSPQLAEEVKKYIIERRIFGALFKKSSGEYQSFESFRRHYVDDMKASGVPVTKFHNFRRFYITTFIEHGGSEAHLRKLVGHASKEMTDTYTVLRDDLGSIAKIVNI